MRYTYFLILPRRYDSRSPHPASLPIWLAFHRPSPTPVQPSIQVVICSPSPRRDRAPKPRALVLSFLESSHKHHQETPRVSFPWCREECGGNHWKLAIPKNAKRKGCKTTPTRYSELIYELRTPGHTAPKGVMPCVSIPSKNWLYCHGKNRGIVEKIWCGTLGRAMACTVNCMDLSKEKNLDNIMYYTYMSIHTLIFIKKSCWNHRQKNDETRLRSLVDQYFVWKGHAVWPVLLTWRWLAAPLPLLSKFLFVTSGTQVKVAGSATVRDVVWTLPHGKGELSLKWKQVGSNRSIQPNSTICRKTMYSPITDSKIFWELGVCFIKGSLSTGL